MVQVTKPFFIINLIVRQHVTLPALRNLKSKYELIWSACMLPHCTTADGAAFICSGWRTLTQVEMVSDDLKTMAEIQKMELSILIASPDRMTSYICSSSLQTTHILGHICPPRNRPTFCRMLMGIRFHNWRAKRIGLDCWIQRGEGKPRMKALKRDGNLRVFIIIKPVCVTKLKLFYSPPEHPLSPPSLPPMLTRCIQTLHKKVLVLISTSLYARAQLKHK